MPTPSQGPYIRTELPLVVMFRALGIVADRDILERIVSSRPAVSIELTLEMQKRLYKPS
jgi:DNA-directed RNA polymerase beta subunit